MLSALDRIRQIEQLAQSCEIETQEGYLLLDETREEYQSLCKLAGLSPDPMCVESGWTVGENGPTKD